MLIYFVPLAFAASAIFMKNRHLDQIAIVVSGAILLFRNGVGWDYENYSNYFETDGSFRSAPVADFLQDLARILSVPNGFMGISAILGTALLLFMSREKSTPRISVFLFLAFPFFFLESFNIVRQILAVLFVALCYQSLRQNQLFFSVIACAIAIRIHPTAVLCLPIFVLVSPILNWRFAIISILFFVIVYFDAQGYISGRSQIYFQGHTPDLSADHSKGSKAGGNYYVIVTGAMLALSLFLRNRELIICASMAFLGAIFFSFFLGYDFNRLLVYFFVPWLFWPMSVVSVTNIQKTLAVVIVVSLLFCASFYVKLREPKNGFDNYVTIYQRT